LFRFYAVPNKVPPRKSAKKRGSVVNERQNSLLSGNTHLGVDEFSLMADGSWLADG